MQNTVEQWILELTDKKETAGRSREEWKDVYSGIFENLLRADSWPGRKGSPKLLLDEIVHRALDPAKQMRREILAGVLLDQLKTAESLNERIFLLRMLELAGGKEEVAGLKELLVAAEEPLREYCLRAIDANPSAEAGKALMALLENSNKDEERVALINALGRRREAPAADILHKFLESHEKTVKEAAQMALKNIAGPNAPHPERPSGG